MIRVFGFPEETGGGGNGCMLAAALDGYDMQAIGYAAPAIAEAFGLPREVFGPVFSAALLGAAFGALRSPAWREPPNDDWQLEISH
jgi:MFS family permease